MTIDEAREILEKLIPQPQRGDGKSITHLMITEALNMAIKALEQEPCDDCISRQAVLDTEYQIKEINDIEYVMLSEVQMKIRKMPSVTPKAEWRFRNNED